MMHEVQLGPVDPTAPVATPDTTPGTTPVTTPGATRSTRPRQIVVGLAIGALVLGAVMLLGLRLGIVSEISLGTGTPHAGTPAPSFTLPTSTGGWFSMEEARGEPIWLTFWTTWCPPCRVEMPDLQEAYQSNPGKYRFIAVDFGESAGVVQSFVDEIGYTLPVAMDPAADVAILYGVMNLPTHFFIDGTGIVREVYAGALSQAQIAERVEDLW